MGLFLSSWNTDILAKEKKKRLAVSEKATRKKKKKKKKKVPLESKANYFRYFVNASTHSKKHDILQKQKPFQKYFYY